MARACFLNVLLLILLPCGLALGQCNNLLDEICISFDYPDRCCVNCQETEPGTLVRAYVVLQGCSMPAGLGGFEFSLCNEGGSPFTPPPPDFVLTYSLPPTAVNIATPPDFVVGLSLPLPQDDCLMLVDIQIYRQSTECWCFGVTPYTPATVPGEIIYADASDPGHLVPMAPCTGRYCESCMMGCLDCSWCPPDFPVTNEGTTWSNLKSLYR